MEFFSKKVVGKKSRILPKNPEKDPLGSINVFQKPTISQNSGTVVV